MSVKGGAVAETINRAVAKFRRNKLIDLDDARQMAWEAWVAAGKPTELGLVYVIAKRRVMNAIRNEGRYRSGIGGLRGTDNGPMGAYVDAARTHEELEALARLLPLQRDKDLWKAVCRGASVRQAAKDQNVRYMTALRQMKKARRLVRKFLEAQPMQLPSTGYYPVEWTNRQLELDQVRRNTSVRGREFAEVYRLECARRTPHTPLKRREEFWDPEAAKKKSPVRVVFPPRANDAPPKKP